MNIFNLLQFLCIIFLSFFTRAAEALNLAKTLTTKQKQSEIIRELLEADVSLCSLSDIGSHRVYDYSMPTLTLPRRFTDRHTFASDESFMEMLQEVNHGIPYKILKKAGAFSENNSIVLFGGSLLDIVFKRASHIKDFDLRLVGSEYMDNEGKCIEAAKAFVESIFDFMLEENMRIDHIENNTSGEQKFAISEVGVSRRKSTVTVFIPERMIASNRQSLRHYKRQTSMCFQLTFAPTPTIEQMLAACQPHPTRLAVFHKRVVLDQLARYCIESACVILHQSDFRNCFVKTDSITDSQWSGKTLSLQLKRYIKYFDKGMDIILPDLDMAKVPRRNLEYNVQEVLALPQLVVVLNAVEGNKIMVGRLSLAKGYEVEDVVTGYYDENPEYNVGEAIHHNIRCLVSGVLDQFKYVAKGEVWKGVFDYVPTLTSRMVDKSYETVTESLLSGSLIVNKVTGYFSVTPPHQIIAQLIAEPLERETKRRKTGLLPPPFKLEKNVLKKLVEKEKTALVTKIESLREELKSKGLDQLVVHYPENVSTDEDLFKAIYGDYGLLAKKSDSSKRKRS